MKISIGIPAYNAEKYLRYALESVEKQTFADWEVIVVDDGSSDATVQIAQEFALQDQRIRWIRQENGGPAAARSRACTEMTPSSDYMMFLDHDDLLEDDALATLITVLESLPDAVAAYGDMRDIDSNGNFVTVDKHGWVPPIHAQWSDSSNAPIDAQEIGRATFAMFAAGNFITTPGMVLIRRSALTAAGNWDTDPAIKVAEDFDMWLRLTLLGDIAYIRQNVLRYRRHMTNASKNVRTMMRADRAVRHKIYRQVKGLPQRARAMKEGSYRQQLDFAHDKLKSGFKHCTRFKVLSGCRQFLYSIAHLRRAMEWRKL